MSPFMACRMWKKSAKTVKKVVAAHQLADAEVLSSGNGTAFVPTRPKGRSRWYRHEMPRPVVTYLYRHSGR